VTSSVTVLDQISVNYNISIRNLQKIKSGAISTAFVHEFQSNG